MSPSAHPEATLTYFCSESALRSTKGAIALAGNQELCIDDRITISKKFGNTTLTCITSATRPEQAELQINGKRAALFNLKNATAIVYGKLARASTGFANPGQAALFLTEVALDNADPYNPILMPLILKKLTNMPAPLSPSEFQVMHSPKNHGYFLFSAATVTKNATVIDHAHTNFAQITTTGKTPEVTLLNRNDRRNPLAKSETNNIVTDTAKFLADLLKKRLDLKPSDSDPECNLKLRELLCVHTLKAIE